MRLGYYCYSDDSGYSFSMSSPSSPDVYLTSPWGFVSSIGNIHNLLIVAYFGCDDASFQAYSYICGVIKNL